MCAPKAGASAGRVIALASKGIFIVEEAQDAFVYIEQVIRGILNGPARNHFRHPCKVPQPPCRQAANGPPRTSPFDPLAQLRNGQFGSILVADCAVFALLPTSPTNNPFRINGRHTDTLNGRGQSSSLLVPPISLFRHFTVLDSAFVHNLLQFVASA